MSIILPIDELKIVEKRFVGKIFYFIKVNEELIEKEIIIDTFKKIPLDPFYFNKPIMIGKKIVFEKDKKPRVGYYPLVIVQNALKPPNHLYRVDDALIAGINMGTDIKPKWETRFFHKHCLDEKTWENVENLLKNIHS
jgi:hypothetical protein